jgi:hypothetical protein
MLIILTTEEAEIRKNMVQDHPLQKVYETLSQKKKLGMMACTCQPSYFGRHK